jgi:hypothetical protein
VVDISHSVADGNLMVYNCKMIDGTMPESGGASETSLGWVTMDGFKNTQQGCGYVPVCNYVP